MGLREEHAGATGAAMPAGCSAQLTTWDSLPEA